MNDEYMSSADIRKKIAELKIKLAFQLEFEEELDKTLAECEMADLHESRLPEDSRNSILREISIGTEKTRDFGAKRRKLEWAGKLVAALVVTLSLCFGSAMATIRMVEIGVLRLDIREDEKGALFGMVETGAVLEVPKEWQGSFYPSYIPEDYSFSYINAAGAWYMDSAGNEFGFDENVSAGKNVDTENADVSTELINGAEAKVIEKEGWVTVIWGANNRYFVVDIQDDKDTALQIAASVVLIK